MIPQIVFEPGASAPLDGIRVIDLSRLVAGNIPRTKTTAHASIFF